MHRRKDRERKKKNRKLKAFKKEYEKYCGG